MALIEIHQRFKGRFLNKLRVSFKYSFRIVCVGFYDPIQRRIQNPVKPQS